MKDTGMTTMEVKKINKNKVYTFIYNEKTTCKLIITQQLQMGLSTVNQNLKILEEEGLICKNGFFDSTGGRKPDAIEIVRTAQISIGVAILKNMIDIVATDLYGEVLYSITKPFTYEHSDVYYKNVGQAIYTFIHHNQIDSTRILGVSIATQGAISPDRSSVSYGVILGNDEMKLSDFQKHISFPCRLAHDSKTAAALELWHNPDITDAVVLLLNRNFGGAIITNGKVQHGTHMRSGSVEHICLNPDGPKCYCGKYGCLETYCSANALSQTAQMPIPDFFTALQENDESCMHIWNNYLKHLARAISNLSVVIDGKFIITGYLAPYIRQMDLEQLLQYINTYATFPLSSDAILVGTTGQFTQAIGASLHYIHKFLTHV